LQIPKKLRSYKMIFRYSSEFNILLDIKGNILV